jgi:hypothetical protein
MPALEISTPAENHEPEIPTAQPIVGIIYPPPEVRSILFKYKHFLPFKI